MGDVFKESPVVIIDALVLQDKQLAHVPGGDVTGNFYRSAAVVLIVNFDHLREKNNGQQCQALSGGDTSSDGELITKETKQIQPFPSMQGEASSLLNTDESKQSPRRHVGNIENPDEKQHKINAKTHSPPPCTTLTLLFRAMQHSEFGPALYPVRVCAHSVATQCKTQNIESALTAAQSAWSATTPSLPASGSRRCLGPSQHVCNAGNRSIKSPAAPAGSRRARRTHGERWKGTLNHAVVLKVIEKRFFCPQTVEYLAAAPLIRNGARSGEEGEAERWSRAVV